ncbi:hypothetical protein CPB83DRAFT_900083 [Crepidotus variabilis]|uniref:Uncharacterized protein n=1 Tax=Crepidotus variabilis TaxID=179855 RepID=A0A9P6E3R3_9AGAR|nr:hypothetical protein CPB83DRAFT_900083 [Crepidotus variabilis]
MPSLTTYLPILQSSSDANGPNSLLFLSWFHNAKKASQTSKKAAAAPAKATLKKPKASNIEVVVKGKPKQVAVCTPKAKREPSPNLDNVEINVVPSNNELLLDGKVAENEKEGKEEADKMGDENEGLVADDASDASSAVLGLPSQIYCTNISWESAREGENEAGMIEYSLLPLHFKGLNFDYLKALIKFPGNQEGNVVNLSHATHSNLIMRKGPSSKAGDKFQPSLHYSPCSHPYGKSLMAATKKSPATAKSTGDLASKYSLNADNMIPLYDGCHERVDLPDSVCDAPKALSRFAGNMPVDTLVMVAYTACVYKQKECNELYSVALKTLWAVVLAVPTAAKMETHLSDEMWRDGSNCTSINMLMPGEPISNATI